MATLLASGDPHGAAIEASLGGLELTVEGGEVGLAIAGGAFDLRLGGHSLPSACALKLAPGAHLSLRPERPAPGVISPPLEASICPLPLVLSLRIRVRGWADWRAECYAAATY